MLGGFYVVKAWKRQANLYLFTYLFCNLLQFGQKVCKAFGKCKSYNAKHGWGWVVGMDYGQGSSCQNYQPNGVCVCVCVCVCVYKCYMIVNVGCQWQLNYHDIYKFCQRIVVLLLHTKGPNAREWHKFCQRIVGLILWNKRTQWSWVTYKFCQQ
jgi:hypothetical protein